MSVQMRDYWPLTAAKRDIIFLLPFNLDLAWRRLRGQKRLRGCDSEQILVNVCQCEAECPSRGYRSLSGYN